MFTLKGARTLSQLCLPVFNSLDAMSVTQLPLSSAASFLASAVKSPLESGSLISEPYLRYAALVSNGFLEAYTAVPPILYQDSFW